MPDWSNLPYDLVVLIANELTELQDFLSFSAVSRSWRSVYLNKHWIPRSRTPWLMLGECTENGVPKRRFFSLSLFKWYNVTLPEAHGCHCWGTCHGYIVMFNQSLTLRLLNPITKVCIDFPTLAFVWNGAYDALDWFTAIQKTFVFKLRDVLITLVSYKKSRSLAFCRQGDAKWTVVPFSAPVSIADVVCFKNQILAVTMMGSLIVIEIDGCETPRALFAASRPENEKCWVNVYLVESSDNLLLVFKYLNSFQVYKLDVLKRKWNKVGELGDRFLLVDDYGCTSGPVYGNFLPNCIYRARDNVESFIRYSNQNRQQKMMIYNIKDESTEFFWINDSPPMRYTCPVWITPYWSFFYINKHWIS